MSFGRNLQTIFGGDWQGLNQDKLKSVSLSEDKETVTFEFQNGNKIRYQVGGDCCSRSWIEHLEVPSDIEGATIHSLQDAPIEHPDTENNTEYDVLQVYNTKFHTDKGTITLEYRNDSNGYYGGYLVRISKES